MAKTGVGATGTNGGGSAAAKPTPKSEIFNQLAEKTGLTRKQIQSVFTELSTLIEKDLGKKGPGVFVIPGLLKLKVKRIPATKARKGINPFTKEPTIFKAKPARKVLKARPVKAAKDAV